MRPILPAVLLCCILLGCGGDDEDAGGPTATPAPPTATPTEPVPEVTPSPTMEAPTPTVTPEPAEDEACGRSLLSEDDPARARLAGLEGTLVFSCGGQIWTARPDGSAQTRLTQDAAIDWEDVRLNLSPNRVPPGPSRQERADLEAQMNTSPRWLADGRVAFASIRDTLRLSADAPPDRPRMFAGATELYVVNADGSGEERVTGFNLTPGSYTGRGDFSPAMECMAPTFCIAGMLTVKPFAGAHTEPTLAVEVIEIRFSECCFLFGTLDLSVPMPALNLAPFEGNRFVGLDWSPDDQVTLSTVQFWEGLSAVDTELRWQPDAPAHTVEGYTNGGSLSPDGTTGAYCGFDSRPGPWSVRIANSATGDARVLLTVEDTLTTRDCRPRWSPDGSHIVLHDGEGRIVAVDVETGDATPVANGSSPDWGP